MGLGKKVQVKMGRERTISLTGFENETIYLTATCTISGKSVKTRETVTQDVSLDNFEKEVEAIDKKICHILDKKEYFIRKQVVDSDWHENESYKEKYDLVKKKLLKKKNKK